MAACDPPRASDAITQISRGMRLLSSCIGRQGRIDDWKSAPSRPASLSRRGMEGPEPMPSHLLPAIPPESSLATQRNHCWRPCTSCSRSGLCVQPQQVAHRRAEMGDVPGTGHQPHGNPSRPRFPPGSRGVSADQQPDEPVGQLSRRPARASRSRRDRRVCGPYSRSPGEAGHVPNWLICARTRAHAQARSAAQNRRSGLFEDARQRCGGARQGAATRTEPRMSMPNAA